jgi:hypothetical protein
MPHRKMVEPGYISYDVFREQVSKYNVPSSQIEENVYWALVLTQPLENYGQKPVFNAARFPVRVLGKTAFEETDSHEVQFSALDRRLNAVKTFERLFGKFAWKEPVGAEATYGKLQIQRGVLIPFKPFAAFKPVRMHQLMHWFETKQEYDILKIEDDSGEVADHISLRAKAKLN